jgi:hypothetical protein
LTNELRTCLASTIDFGSVPMIPFEGAELPTGIVEDDFVLYSPTGKTAPDLEKEVRLAFQSITSGVELQYRDSLGFPDE